MLTSHQLRLFTAITVTVLVLTVPLEALNGLVWIAIHLFELLELIYELLEFILDETIYHVFHTSRHVTQVIVFYLMTGLFLFGLHRAVKGIRGVFRKEPIGIPGAWAKPIKNIAGLFNWLYLDRRAQMIFGVTFGITFLVMVAF